MRNYESTGKGNQKPKPKMIVKVNEDDSQTVHTNNR